VSNGASTGFYILAKFRGSISVTPTVYRAYTLPVRLHVDFKEMVTTTIRLH